MLNPPQLCDAFIRISKGVWHWMRRANRVRNPALRVRANLWHLALRETTITDYVVLRLLEECAPSIQVMTFPEWAETLTGADLELWLTDASGRWLGLRVQCKILGPQGEFEGLHYQSRQGYQCDLLIDASSRTGTWPLYLLYLGPTPALRRWVRPAGCGHRPYCWRDGAPLWGAWWLSAHRVQAVRPRKDLPALLHLIVPWHCMVCCPFTSGVGVERVAQCLADTVFAGHEDQRPPLTQRPPEYVLLAREGRLPEAADSLRRILEGSEMRHLVLIDLD